jgi:uncharacterized membrane protein YvbJ
MGVERRCMQCGTWNKDEDFCSKCGNSISPVQIEKERELKREEIRKNTPPSALDVFLDKWENSPYFVLRVLFKIVYGVSIAFMAIASFFAYLAASPNA